MFHFIKQGSERSVTIKKNIIGSLVVKGCAIIVQLLIVPITLGYVSSELYGIWLTISSIMLWLNFFDVGFTLGLKNKLAEAIALGDWDRGRKLVSTTYFMMMIIFIPLCMILEIFIPMINWSSFLNVSPIYNDEITTAMHILAVCFCVQMIVNVISTVASSFQKVALSSAFITIGNFLSLIVIYILTLCCPPSLSILALTISVMPIVVLGIFSFVLYNSVFKKVAPSFKAINRKCIHDIFGLGLKFFIIQIQVVVMFQSTNILISNLSGPDDVTAYNIAYKYIGIGMMLYGIALQPLWPAFTDAFTRKDYGWMRQIYRKMIFVYAISVVGILFMLAISPISYRLWIGDKADIPLLMSLLIALYMILHSWDSLQVMMLNGIGAIKLQTYVTIIGLVFHIPLSVFFGQYVGGYGVIISMTIIVIIYLCVFTIQIRKILNQTASGIWVK